MRDAKLSFLYTTSTSAGAAQLGVAGFGPQFTISSVSYNVGATLSHASASGAAVAVTTELNYGGLLTNGVSGAVMDNDNSGTVDANDYVRGQILNPLYVVAPITVSQINPTDTLLMEVHGGAAAGFALSSSTVVAQTIWTPPVATAQIGSVTTGAGTPLTAGTLYYVQSVNTATNTITFSATRAGAAIAGISAVVPNAQQFVVNQVVQVGTTIPVSSTSLPSLLTATNDSNSVILSVPVQSYAKFLKVRWTPSALRNSGGLTATVAVGRTAIQTGREGSY
jgi:hypothetical protein